MGTREQGRPQQAGGWPAGLTLHGKACYLCPGVGWGRGGHQELTQGERWAQEQGAPHRPMSFHPLHRHQVRHLFPLLLTVSHAMSGETPAPSFGPDPFCRWALGAPVHLGAANASRGSPWEGLKSPPSTTGGGGVPRGACLRLARRSLPGWPGGVGRHFLPAWYMEPQSRDSRPIRLLICTINKVNSIH